MYRDMSEQQVVDQAVGVIMRGNGCSVAEAMAVLRSASTHRNVTMRDVAEAVLGTLLGDDAGTGEPFTAGP